MVFSYVENVDGITVIYLPLNKKCARNVSFLINKKVSPEDNTSSGVYKFKRSSLWSILSINLWHQRIRFQELDIKYNKKVLDYT